VGDGGSSKMEFNVDVVGSTMSVKDTELKRRPSATSTLTNKSQCPLVSRLSAHAPL
jgi:hypothetical protein